MSKVPPPPINENLTFGIDLGIASCGWAVIERKGHEVPKILGSGSWCFNMPEEDKTRTPLNQNRREKRLLRRVIRRRRQRMQKIRSLFDESGLFQLPNGKKEPLNRDILGKIGADLREKSQDELSPWVLRVRGLDNLLSGPELAVALGHIAKHRGFKSNAKNGGKEDSKIKNAFGEIAKIIEENPEEYRTFSEVLVKHPNYQERFRNRNENYHYTPSRDLLCDEVKHIFKCQRVLGSKIATKELEEKFCGFAFHQRPLQDSHKLVGYCGLERQKNPQNKEKRASMKAPSFEQFRMLTKLAHLEIQSMDKDGVITPRHLNAQRIRKNFAGSWA